MILIIMKDVILIAFIIICALKLFNEISVKTNEENNNSSSKLVVIESESARRWKILMLIAFFGIGRTVVLLKSFAILVLGIPVLKYAYFSYGHYEETGRIKFLARDSIILIFTISFAVINLIY